MGGGGTVRGKHLHEDVPEVLKSPNRNLSPKKKSAAHFFGKFRGEAFPLLGHRVVSLGVFFKDNTVKKTTDADRQRGQDEMNTMDAQP